MPDEESIVWRHPIRGVGEGKFDDEWRLASCDRLAWVADGHGQKCTTTPALGTIERFRSSYRTSHANDGTSRTLGGNRCARNCARTTQSHVTFEKSKLIAR